MIRNSYSVFGTRSAANYEQVLSRDARPAPVQGKMAALDPKISKTAPPHPALEKKMLPSASLVKTFKMGHGHAWYLQNCPNLTLERVPHAKINTAGEKNSSSMLPTLTSGETLCRDNRRLIGTPLTVIARQSQKNRE